MFVICSCIISMSLSIGIGLVLTADRAILIMFYRPYGTESPEGLHPAQQQKWQHRMRREADTAASRTNDILDMLAQENLLEFALPMTYAPYPLHKSIKP